MAEPREVRWSCGCHEVDGQLEVRCTQTPNQGELSAERHAVSQPYSAKCFRTAEQVAAPEAEPAQQAPAASEPSSQTIAAPAPEPAA